MTEENTTPEAEEKIDPDEKGFVFSEYIADLDMEEMDFVESISGCSVDEVEIPGRPKSLFLAAVGLAYARRSGKDISWAEVRKLKMPGIKDLITEASTVKKATGPQDHKKKVGKSAPKKDD
jgi:hypothetical protein